MNATLVLFAMFLGDAEPDDIPGWLGWGILGIMIVDMMVTSIASLCKWIKAANGFKMWQRKRLIDKLLTPIDYAAFFICFIAIAAVVPTIILLAIVRLLKELRNMWTTNDRVILVILAISVAWCAIRWKTLNARH